MRSYIVIIIASLLGSYLESLWPPHIEENGSCTVRPLSRNSVRIRVAQWNIGKLNMGRPGITSITKDNRDTKLREYNRLLNEVRADVFCFNEYAPYFSLKDSINEDTLDLTRIAMLSMYSNCQYGKRYGANCNCIATAGFRQTNLLSHIYKRKKQQRYYSFCDIHLNGQTVKIVSTHLELPKYKLERESEIKELLKAFEMDPYVIICGDFNVQDVTEYNVFSLNGYVMANHGFMGDIVTYPNKSGGRCLDNILCKGFDVLGVDVYKTRLSDHYIIACDVVMRGGKSYY